MTRPLTVLVLTPSIGGYFYGEHIAGLAREVAGAGARLVVVQTLEAGTHSGEVGEAREAGDFATPVALSQVDGVVSLNAAVSSSFLQRVRDAGKPVVLTTAPSEDFAAPLVRPNNYRGTYAAVEHLIAHGHTRIAFAGNFAQPDVPERYASYVAALNDHHLAADPALVFTAHSNARAGGVEAARALLAAPQRPTAVMVATDRNAIGLMATLIESGVAIPQDVAVIGFDNTEAALVTTPTLSSVNQRFYEIGALAGQLVLAGMRGESVPNDTYCPEAAAIATRDSCGCSSARIDTAIRVEHASADPSGDVRGEDLRRTVFADMLTGEDSGERLMDSELAAIVSEADRLLRLGDRVTTAQIHALTSSVSRLSPRLDVLRRVTLALTEYIQRQSASTSQGLSDGALAVGAARLTSALWHLQSAVFLRQLDGAETMLDTQLAVDARLLDTSHSDPRLLEWLSSTDVRAAVLALWDDDPASGAMRVAGAYDPTGQLHGLVDTIVTPECFPPAPLIDILKPAERELCVVVPVSTIERDWGLLAVVGGDSGTPAARKSYQHWAALLCASLESHRLQEQVRRSALYDDLTGLPNRQLLVDHLEHSIALWRRSGVPFSVIFLDLDGFKLVNDSLGHQVGDHVLQSVAADITRELRSVDTGARFGGDEFVILLNDTDAPGAQVVAERLLTRLAAVQEIDGHEVVTQASMGIATSAFEYSNAEDVLHDADTAMYRAKAAGPGTLAFFEAPSPLSAVEPAGAAPEPD